MYSTLARRPLDSRSPRSPRQRASGPAHPLLARGDAALAARSREPHPRYPPSAMDAEPDVRTPAQRGASRLVRLVAGDRPEGNYVLTRFVVLRVFGLVCVAAFATAVTQLVPLVG